MKKIYAKDLIKINDLKSFHSAKAVLFLDLIEIPDWLPLSETILVYKGKKYLKVVLTGKPENLTPGKEFIFQTHYGYQSYTFNGQNLEELISNGGIYDISKFYRDLNYCAKNRDSYVYNLRLSNQFIIDTFLLPYLKG